MQRIIIITSCTGKKRVHCQQALTLPDFRAGASHIARREQELSDMLIAAEELYTGQQHLRLMQGIHTLRKRNAIEERDLNIDLWILSAGYGLIAGGKMVAPYECTFAGMKKKVLRAWANALHISSDIRSILEQSYDLCLILLGDDYLSACNLDGAVQLGGPTLIFCGSAAAAALPFLPHLRIVTLSHGEAKHFSCSLVSLKGELARQLLTQIAEDESRMKQLSHPEIDILSFCRANFLGNGHKRTRKKVEKPEKVKWK